MLLKDFIDRFETYSDEAVFSAADTIDTTTGLSHSITKELCKLFVQQLERKCKIRASVLFNLGTRCDSKRFLEFVKTKGLLRCSRYKYNSSVQNHSLLFTLNKSPSFLSNDARKYLDNLCMLYEIAAEVLLIYERITQWLKTHKECGIKSLLAVLDFLFLKKTIHAHHANKDLHDSNSAYFFTVEDYAKGFSTILAIYYDEVGDLEKNEGVLEDIHNNEEYISLLMKGAMIASFREWEHQVDRFGYSISKNDSEYKIDHQDQEFLRSIDLGFIEIEAQTILRTLDWMDPELKSIYHYAPTFMGEFQRRGFINLEKLPVPRWRFQFSSSMLKATCNAKLLFQEETIALQHACRGLMVDIDQLMGFKLTDNISMYDLFRVSRLFQFTRAITTSKLVSVLDRNPSIVFQSLIPVFQIQALKNLVNDSLESNISGEIIDTMSVKIHNHIDIQYTPLIQFDKHVYFPMNIYAMSNIFRNPMQLLEKRIYHDGTIDPVSDMLAAAFRELGAEPHKKVEFTSGEVDLLVKIDNKVYVFECKNALQPSDFHELMTSYDYMHEATRQLNNFIDKMQLDKYRKEIFDKTKIMIDDTTEIRTGIIMSNRMFVGYRSGIHPIRGLYETIHFIKKGNVSMGDRDLKFWSGDCFSSNELDSYLLKDVTFTDRWKSMDTYNTVFVFDNCRVLVKRFRLNNLLLMQEYGFELTEDEINSIKESDFRENQNNGFVKQSIKADKKSHRKIKQDREKLRMNLLQRKRKRS